MTSPLLSPQLRPQRVKASRPLHWLALAWQDMARGPTVSVIHGLILAIASATLFWLARHAFWWIAAMLSASMIVAPLLAIGLYDVSRRLERGEVPTLGGAFRIWTCGDKRLIQFGALLALCSVGWLLCSAALVHWILPASVYQPADFVRLVVLDPHLGLFEVWVLMSGFLAAPMFASTLVTIPLLLEYPDLRIQDAVGLSWRVVALNPVAMACWAGLLCLFTTVGFGSAFLGLVVVVPLLGHASWHAYRDLIVDARTTH